MTVNETIKMSIISQAKDLENFSDQMLMQLGQQPDARYPGYLVVSEVQRRADLEKRYNNEKAKADAASPPPIAEQRFMGLAGAEGVDSTTMMAYGGGLIPGYQNGGQVTIDPVGEVSDLARLFAQEEPRERSIERRKAFRARNFRDAGIKPDDLRFKRKMRDIEMTAYGYEPEMLMHPGSGITESPTKAAGDKFAQYQMVLEQIKSDPRAYDYYTGEGVDVSSGDAFADTAYERGFFGLLGGKNKLKVDDYLSDLAQEGIAIRQEGSSPGVRAALEQVVQTTPSAAAADDVDISFDSLVRGGSGGLAADYDKERDRIRDATTKMQVRTQAETDLSTLRREEAERETALLKRQLGLDDERIAELMGGRRTGEETDRLRKANLLSKLGSALMGNPRNLGAGLERTTSGILDLDESLRSERRADDEAIYGQRSVLLDAERSGMRNIASLKGSELEALAATLRLGEEDRDRDLSSLGMQELAGMDRLEQLRLSLSRARETQSTGGRLSAADYEDLENRAADAINRIVGDRDERALTAAERAVIAQIEADMQAVRIGGISEEAARYAVMPGGG